MENKYSVILFESNNYAMWCKKMLEEANIEVKLVNVPRHLSSDCGYCLRIENSVTDRVVEMMNSDDIEYQEIVIL